MTFPLTCPWLCVIADGLVSYSALAGQEMTYRGLDVHLNDSVYDGSMGLQSVGFVLVYLYFNSGIF